MKKTKQIISDSDVKAALVRISNHVFRYGRAAVEYAADYESLFAHLSAQYAGFKLPGSVRASDPVLFEWRQIMPPEATHKIVVLFTPFSRLQVTEMVHEGGCGKISVAMIRDVSLEEILSYARTYSPFSEYVHERVETIFFRIEKFRKLPRAV
jgi:hypothetical protein